MKNKKSYITISFIGFLCFLFLSSFGSNVKNIFNLNDAHKIICEQSPTKFSKIYSYIYDSEDTEFSIEDIEVESSPQILSSDLNYEYRTFPTVPIDILLCSDNSFYYQSIPLYSLYCSWKYHLYI